MVGDLGSYYESEIRLNDQDLPIEYGFKVSAQRISPALRSGSQVGFGVTRILSVAGKLVIRRGSRQVPFANSLAVLARNEQRKTISTEADGTFNLEDMEPATYTGFAVVDGTACRFELTVPKTEGVFFDAKDIVLCR